MTGTQTISHPTTVSTTAPTRGAGTVDLRDHEFFVLVGAMKAGTTSLAAYLGRHPRVVMASRKEPQFFSRDEIYSRGMDWYAGLFAGCQPEHVLGEASTCYSRHATYPRAAERLHEHLPHARLVYLLRHPVERLYSQYVYNMQTLVIDWGGSAITFDQYVRENEEAMDASNYSAQIERYTRFFDASRLHCVLFDELFSTSTNASNGLFTFLQLEHASIGTLSQVHEKKRTSAITRRKANALLSRLRNSFLTKQLADIVPKPARPRLRKAAHKILTQSSYGRSETAQFFQSLPKLSAASRKSLCQHFRPSVLKLEEFLGRRLAHWLD